MIKALIVDDEPLARKTINYSLKAFEDWEVCGECERGDEVMAQLGLLTPDVVFLDIKMPGLDGLTICSKIQAMGSPPIIIFVTAFDAHAVEAFELCALDYLLKPYDDKRFEKTIEKTEQRLSQVDVQNVQLEQLSQLTKNKESKIETLIVRSVGRIQLVDVKTVNWLSTAGNYVELHQDDQTILHRVSLRSLEQHLSDGDFIRVHRTAMIRLSKVKEFLTIAEGQYAAILNNGDKVSVSQSYKDKLLEKLGI